MKKNYLKITLLAFFVICLCAVSASATETAQPSTHSVYVNGEKMEVGAFTINGNNYFKLRDLAMILNGTDAQFDVAWNAEENTIAIWANKPYTPVGGELNTVGLVGENAKHVQAWWIYYEDSADTSGKEISLPGCEIGWNNYFGLRDMAYSLGFTVEWNEAEQRIDIQTPGYQKSNDEDENAVANDTPNEKAQSGEETISITLRGRVTYDLDAGYVSDGFASYMIKHPAKNAELTLYIGHRNMWEYVEVGKITTDDNGFFEIEAEINPQHAKTILSYYCVAGTYIGVDGNTYYGRTYDLRHKRTITTAYKLEELKNLQDGDTFTLQNAMSENGTKGPDELWASSILQRRE